MGSNSPGRITLQRSSASACFASNAQRPTPDIQTSPMQTVRLFPGRCLVAVAARNLLFTAPRRKRVGRRAVPGSEMRGSDRRGGRKAFRRRRGRCRLAFRPPTARLGAPVESREPRGRPMRPEQRRDDLGARLEERNTPAKNSSPNPARRRNPRLVHLPHRQDFRRPPNLRKPRQPPGVRLGTSVYQSNHKLHIHDTRGGETRSSATKYSNGPAAAGGWICL